MVDPAVHHPGHCRSGRVIRIPVHLVESINRVKRRQGSLRKNGREPTAEEIAVRLDMEPDRVRELLQLAQDPISLETPVGEEEDAHLEDLFRMRKQAFRWTRPGGNCCGGSWQRPQEPDTQEERVLTLRFGWRTGRPAPWKSWERSST